MPPRDPESNSGCQAGYLGCLQGFHENICQPCHWLQARRLWRTCSPSTCNAGGIGCSQKSTSSPRTLQAARCVAVKRTSGWALANMLVVYNLLPFLISLFHVRCLTRSLTPSLTLSLSPSLSLSLSLSLALPLSFACVLRRYCDLVKREGKNTADEIRESKRELQESLEEGEAPWVMPHPDQPRNEASRVNCVYVVLCMMRLLALLQLSLPVVPGLGAHQNVGINGAGEKGEAPDGDGADCGAGS